MSTGLAAVLFVVSLAATLYAAAVFAERLDHLGERLGLPEGLLGLLTAAGADAPELATAIAALATGAKSAGFGVVVGSNVFNIGAMVGVSALLSGNVRIQHDALALEGGVALGITVVVVLLVFGVLPAWAAVTLALLVLAPYAAVALRRELGARRHPEGVDARAVLLIPPALAVIVLGSIGMVHTGLRLGDAAGSLPGNFVDHSLRPRLDAPSANDRPPARSIANASRQESSLPSACSVACSPAWQSTW